MRGLIVRCGLTALPLGFILLLCGLMSGWPGRATDDPSAAGSLSGLSIPNILLPSADAATLNWNKPQAPQAGFERLHVAHARINVPE